MVGFATLSAEAENVRFHCGTGGALTAVGDTDLTPPAGAEVPSDIASYLCGRMSDCFSKFPEVGRLTATMAVTLASYRKNAEDIRARVNGARHDSDEFWKQIEHLRKTVLSCERRHENRVPSKSGFDQPAFEETPKIVLDPSEGMNRNKRGVYYKNALETVITHALNQGTDPYLAVAIVMMENPPVDAVNQYGDNYEPYASDYGLIPVDAIAAYDALNCLSPGTKRMQTKYFTKVQMREMSQLRKSSDYEAFVYDQTELESVKVGKKIAEPSKQKMYEIILEIMKTNPTADLLEMVNEINCFEDSSCIGVSRRPSSTPELDFFALPSFDLKDSRIETLCGDIATISTAQTPGFTALGTGPCCIKTIQSGELSSTDLNTALGAQYLKRFIQSCVAEDRKHSISYCLQKYNGLGCFGCSEQMKNDCLYKLEMAKTPVYGARVADLITGTLMRNPEFNQMVADQVKRMRVGATSIFCLRESPGAKSVKSDTYHRELRGMLGGRRACQKYFN